MKTTKLGMVRVLAAAAIVGAAALAFSISTAGAQSVPVDDNNGSPTAPVTPPQSPVEPPANDGGFAGAGSGPSLLPSTGSGGEHNGADTSAIVLLAVAGAAAAGAGVSLRRSSRSR